MRRGQEWERGDPYSSPVSSTKKPCGCTSKTNPSMTLQGTSRLGARQSLIDMNLLWIHSTSIEPLKVCQHTNMGPQEAHLPQVWTIRLLVNDKCNAPWGGLKHAHNSLRCPALVTPRSLYSKTWRRTQEQRQEDKHICWFERAGCTWGTDHVVYSGSEGKRTHNHYRNNSEPSRRGHTTLEQPWEVSTSLHWK